MGALYVAGSLNMDLTMQADRVPGAGETLPGHDFLTTPGGKGANQAAAAAHLGARVHMLGAVGQDGFGRELKENLARFGADVQGVLTVPAATGVAMIAVSDGDNRILVAAGANGAVQAADLEKALDAAESGDILAAQLEIPLPSVLAALKKAKTKGMRTVLNPAPVLPHPLPDDFYAVSDILVPNEHECRQLSGIYPEDEASIRAAGAFFAARGVRELVITLGSRGAAWVHDGELKMIPSVKVKAIDSTSAGDCFIGCLCASLLEGFDLEKALYRSVRAGALAVTRAGAQVSLPNRAELEDFIHLHP